MTRGTTGGAWALALAVGISTPAAAPPAAKKVTHMLTLHGDQLQDDYFWLRERENPEVKAYLEKENAYADAFMKPTQTLQKTLYDEMLGRIKETDLSVPYREKGYFYYSRTEKGKQYPIYCRKKGSLEAPEEVYLDVNELAKGERFMSVAARVFTDDGRLLAYTTDNTGFRDYTLRIKDMSTGKLLSETVARVTSVAWAPDNKTLFYATTDPAKRPYRLYRHTVGTDPSTDALLYEEKDERFRVGVFRSRSGAYLFFPVGSHTTSEWRYLPASAPIGELRMIAPREAEHEYSVDHRGDLFYIQTNDKGRNNRLVTAPVADPRHENWKELIPHRDDVMLEDFDVFANWTVLYERQDALPRIRVKNEKDGGDYRVDFPEAIYSAGPRTTASSTRRRCGSSTSPTRRPRPSTTSTWRPRHASSSSSRRCWAATTPRATPRSGVTPRPPTGPGSRSRSSIRRAWSPTGRRRRS